MTNYTNVSARAMLVSLQLSTWEGFKFDKRVSRNVNEQHKAKPDAGRFNKNLMSGVPEHKRVIQAARAARKEHYLNTLPWSDDNWRLLPSANFMTYSDRARARRAEFDDALAEFYAAWPTILAESPTRLAGLYRADDFPKTASALRGRFAWTLDFNPVPSADIRCDLPADTLSAVEANITERVESATRDAMQRAWKRLHEAVTRVRHAASEDGTLRTNLFDYVRETVDVLGRLNVGQDEHLDAMRDRVLREISTLDVTDLRKSDALRKDTERRADEILKSMGGFFTPPTKADDAAA